MWKGRDSSVLEVSQPYDSTLKALFEGHAPEVLYHLIGAIYVDELPTEALKPSLRPDRVYLGWYQDVLVVLHLEIEAAQIPAEQRVRGREVHRGGNLMLRPVSLDAAAAEELGFSHAVRELENGREHFRQR